MTQDLGDTGLFYIYPLCGFNKTLRLNNVKTRTAMNTKMSLFVICVEMIIYLLLYNLRECTFNLAASWYNNLV